MIIDGRAIAQKISDRLATRIKDLKTKGVTPKLVIVKVGNDLRTQTYIRVKQLAAKKLGIKTEVKAFDAQTSATQLDSEVRQLITDLNQDPTVHGIIVQLPIEADLDDQELIDLITPNKDVDGLTATNQAALEAGRELMVPATPLGIISLLNNENIPISNSKVALVGLGRLVGRPLSFMLEARGAELKVANSKTTNLKAITDDADIVIAASGQPHLIKADMVKKSSVLIDVGLSEIDGQLTGDIDPAAKEKASMATQTTGGVGPMTVISLLSNVVLAAEIQASLQ
ncbi:bifunctional 5,10-methylenetetrahydrofolate dehydrogenase/5,10-methenyltetrahydrofolate cyclohydrolase [Candidatus Berkelbacteria bacterium]|nr:bifunctional 5,10-methylenetetrahydrofolate dehydrogenase/5,10-methenyltetrahydrofolate cyclohydrolase [Candidatus Berkelbacteria bacterium]